MICFWVLVIVEIFLIQVYDFKYKQGFLYKLKCYGRNFYIGHYSKFPMFWKGEVILFASILIYFIYIAIAYVVWLLGSFILIKTFIDAAEQKDIIADIKMQVITIAAINIIFCFMNLSFLDMDKQICFLLYVGMLFLQFIDIILVVKFMRKNIDISLKLIVVCITLFFICLTTYLVIGIVKFIIYPHEPMNLNVFSISMWLYIIIYGIKMTGSLCQDVNQLDMMIESIFASTLSNIIPVFTIAAIVGSFVSNSCVNDNNVDVKGSEK